MVLSIGMIVRDGEQYLEQCLTALQPILNELDSELIIVDTGSTDRTVEIAKKFTDKVFFFEWVNDFSAARNETLRRAKGEWFIYIDQDEVAVDCTGIIKFFKSGEYRKYNSAAYVQRNLKSLDDPTVYDDFRQIVAVKREEDTRFVNEFHEMLYPIHTPLKYLNFIVIHYGFAFGGEGGIERARAKGERNLKGLLDDLEHTVGEPRISIYKLISDCYVNLGDIDKALEYLDIGMAKMDRNEAPTTIMYYARKSLILFYKLSFLDIIDLANEYFNVEINPYRKKEYSTDCLIRMHAGQAYFFLDDFRNAIGEFIKVFDLYKRYNNGKLLTEELTAISWSIHDSDIKECYISFFTCCLTEKEYELAEKYAREMPLEKFTDDAVFMRIYFRMRTVLMRFTGYNGFGKFYSDMNEQYKEILRRKLFSAPPENLDMMLKKMYVLGGTAKELAEIYREVFDDTAEYRNKIAAFLKSHGSENYDDLLYILLKVRADITPFVLTEDFSAERAAKALLELFPDIVEIVNRYNVEKVSPDGIIGAIGLYGELLQRVLEKALPISALFEKYAVLGQRWDSVFGNAGQVTDEVFAALHASVAVLAKRNKNRDVFTKAIIDLKKLTPSLEEIANAYEWESEDSFTAPIPTPQPTPQTELEKLATKVKQDIRNLIAVGNLADAKTLLGEFKEICPNDPDISAIAGELSEA